MLICMSWPQGTLQALPQKQARSTQEHPWSKPFLQPLEFIAFPCHWPSPYRGNSRSSSGWYLRATRRRSGRSVMPLARSVSRLRIAPLVGCPLGALIRGRQFVIPCWLAENRLPCLIIRSLRTLKPRVRAAVSFRRNTLTGMPLHYSVIICARAGCKSDTPSDGDTSLSAPVRSW
ncbi:hypothetical protein LY78DRAFT_56700 [Colletotrichum sublineola]|nr:hypothetical protein LY78DRAFT_56700 [Colletotrichum sublineola]